MELLMWGKYQYGTPLMATNTNRRQWRLVESYTLSSYLLLGNIYGIKFLGNTYTLAAHPSPQKTYIEDFGWRRQPWSRGSA